MGAVQREFGPAVRSSALRMFIAPEEVKQCLDILRAERQLVLFKLVYAERSIRGIEPAEILDVREPLDLIMIADEHFDVSSVSWADATVYLAFQRGWLCLELPLRVPEVLSMATLSYRSAVVSASELFRRAKRQFSRMLVRGVEVEGVRREGSRRPWKDVYYSPGAKELAERGVIWRQNSIETQRYYPANLS